MLRLRSVASYKFRLIEPVASLIGSRMSVYVPLLGNVKTSFQSTRPEVVEVEKLNGPPLEGPAKSVPSGFNSSKLKLGLTEPLKVALENATLSRPPAVPVKLILAFCPGVLIVIGI